MLDLAKHIVTSKTADFDPEKFEDRYEEALTELVNAKRTGKTIGAKPRPKGENVVDLMDALKKSLAGTERACSACCQKPRSAARRCRPEGNAHGHRGQEAAAEEGREARAVRCQEKSGIARRMVEPLAKPIEATNTK